MFYFWFKYFHNNFNKITLNWTFNSIVYQTSIVLFRSLIQMFLRCILHIVGEVSSFFGLDYKEFLGFILVDILADSININALSIFIDIYIFVYHSPFVRNWKQICISPSKNLSAASFLLIKPFKILVWSFDYLFVVKNIPSEMIYCIKLFGYYNLFIN